MPEHASQLYARNVQSLLELLTDDEGALHLDFEDEIVAGACVTSEKEGAQDDRRGSTLVTNLAILVLSGFVGYAVISKVPNTLHTPLMSGTNAIHGIVVLGGLLLAGDSGGVLTTTVILFVADRFGAINVVGGFVVTDRMLEMFKSKPKEQVEAAAEPDARRLLPAGSGLQSTCCTSSSSGCSSTAFGPDRAQDGSARQPVSRRHEPLRR